MAVAVDAVTAVVDTTALVVTAVMNAIIVRGIIAGVPTAATMVSITIVATVADS